MGYTIEYDSFSIRTPAGITILWLAGSNNVTEVHYRGLNAYERRSRKWGLFGNHPCLSEEKLIELGESMTGGTYQEHWKRKGRWVDDAGLMRWIGKHIKNAVPLEDFLDANHLAWLDCRLSVWNKELSNRKELSANVSTSEEFDSWVAEAETLSENLEKDNSTAAVYFDIGTNLPEELYKPVACKSGRCVIKKGSSYVDDYAFGSDGYLSMLSFTKDMKAAKVVDLDTAYRIVKSNLMLRYNSPRRVKNTATLVDADDFARRLKNAKYRKTPERDFVVVLDKTECIYVDKATKRPSRRLYRTAYLANAKRFTEKEAEQFVQCYSAAYKHPDMHYLTANKA